MFYRKTCTCIATLLLTCCCKLAAAQELSLEVKVDVSAAPELQDWGNSAESLIRDWYPRLNNLLPTKGVSPPQKITFRIKKSNKGVGATSGNIISVSSSWIEKHPEDIGLVLHELVHVIQAYPSGAPWWVTEGIADYMRWGIYEGKELTWFPRPKGKQGFKQGYRAAAGFFLWLESDKAPGIVKKLNSAMRKQQYDPKIFKTETGQALEALWFEYTEQLD